MKEKGADQTARRLQERDIPPFALFVALLRQGVLAYRESGNGDLKGLIQCNVYSKGEVDRVALVINGRQSGIRPFEDFSSCADTVLHLYPETLETLLFNPSGGRPEFSVTGDRSLFEQFFSILGSCFIGGGEAHSSE